MQNSLKSVLSWFVSREVWRKTIQPCWAKNERDLARLLLQLRKTDSNPVSQLPDLIKPGRFDDVVNAVKNIEKFHFNRGVQNVATPSLSLKTGHSLNKCINILRDQALRRKDEF